MSALFEVVMAPSQYRVRIDQRTSRLEIVSVLFGDFVGDREEPILDPVIEATLVRLGVDIGVLPDYWLTGHDPRSIDQKRLASALFVTPKLVPCGSCGNWRPIWSTGCAECGSDPRRIVETCVECDGNGETHPYTRRDSVTCPLCDGAKVTYTGTGKARADYLSSAVSAGILTAAQRSAAIVEVLP